MAIYTVPCFLMRGPRTFWNSPFAHLPYSRTRSPHPRSKFPSCRKAVMPCCLYTNLSSIPETGGSQVARHAIDAVSSLFGGFTEHNKGVSRDM
ncbi:hypothetical protein BDN67DRAFT_363616 [Paxillus ammoniavirescens]|nr:hypothetical protein BDN67DRAFT_363616 [Paxillus ammoniavirescens]